MVQFSLFGNDAIWASIPGLIYEPEFLSRDEEAKILEIVRSLPLRPAKYKDYLARRKVTSFGGSFDFDTNELLSGKDLDERLLPLRDKVAQWALVEPESLIHALVAEYAIGTPLGWHRDVPNFNQIFGVSLGSSATLRFRPYPYRPECQRQVVTLVLEPRSIYRMSGDARWKWQHSVEPTRETRWSITFRDARNKL